MARIDDAVRRILRVKWELGLFTQPFGDETLLATVGSAAHRRVAREAVRKSLVLLKNEGGVLPLAPATPHILVAGGAADDLGVQCGGWTIEWQGGRGSITTGTTLLAALRQEAPKSSLIDYQPEGQFAEAVHAPVALVVLGEAPYAEGEGDRADLSLSADAIALVERVRRHCERLVVLLYSGRPLLINPILPLCDALVAAWLPGTEGAGVVDLLFGVAPFTGTLAYTWPQGAEQDPLFPRGYGLR
jgi:beta-glucosidase